MTISWDVNIIFSTEGAEMASSAHSVNFEGIPLNSCKCVSIVVGVGCVAPKTSMPV